jgi:hypothetical protein
MKKNTIPLNANEEPKPVSRSKAKEEFAALIEAYKKQNPVKYEMKKAALEAELAKCNH